jgi:hypothetical protein
MKKHKSVYIFIVLLVFVFTSCKKDKINPEAQALCEAEGGQTVTDVEGRIYQWTSSKPHFFYIGNPNKVLTGVNGGYIPCGGLPKEFQQEGLLVTYSGVDKGSLSDTGDPLHAYISLFKIEKKQ